MDKASRIYIAGHAGLAGSAIVRRLLSEGFENLLLPPRESLDLREAGQVRAFFQQQRPEYVIIAAAKVGGILANSTYPAEFIYDNLAIQTNLIEAARRYGVRKLVLLGSSCIYPKLTPQPIKEEYLLTGALEPTNEWYAVAKIAGIKLVQAYRRQYGFSGICLMPTNLYGPGDCFHPQNSHVVPALLQRFCEAQRNGDAEVAVWGTGEPRREFLYVDDFAAAVVLLLQTYDEEAIINVGTGEDVTIAELARLVAKTCGYSGRVVFDPSKPDGTPRKLLDVSRLRALGWRPTVSLREGLREAYTWYTTQCRSGLLAVK